MQSSTPFPLLRTYFSITFRQLRFLVINSLNVVSIVLVAVGFSTQNPVVTLISIVGLAVGIASVVASFVTWNKDVRDLRIQPLPARSMRDMKRIKVARRLGASGYEILYRRGRPSDALLTSMQINHALFQGANCGLSIEKKAFRSEHSAPVAHVLLRAFTQKKPVLFNARKVRLLSDPILKDGSLAEVFMQPTRYFDTLMTNDSSSVRLTSYKSRSQVFDGRALCFPDGIIPNCGQSACANQVGASTIALTSDDYLVIVEQGSRSNTAKGLLMPSGSGSADWDDVVKFSDLQQFVKSFALRELAEECGLVADDVAWCRIIGYGRLLDRGGLPQFFCLAKLKCPFSQIKVTRVERPLTDYHYPIDIYENGQNYYGAIMDTIKTLRRNGDRLFSSLWWSLEMLSLMSPSDMDDAFSDSLRAPRA